jgi:hypothetical protein
MRASSQLLASSSRLSRRLTCQALENLDRNVGESDFYRSWSERKGGAMLSRSLGKRQSGLICRSLAERGKVYQCSCIRGDLRGVSEV